VVTDPAYPRAGVEYPGTWREFRTQFTDDAACSAYLERLRWRDGFRCPKCDSKKGWRTVDGRWSCAGCARKVSVTAGTIFDRSRTSLQEWFAAAWYITNQKYGVSALGLQRLLGLGSYQTAWTILHKLRTAMVRPGRDRLRGSVEVDETYVGGVEKGVHGRETHKKSIVVIAVEVLSPKGFGRTRMRRIPDVSGESLLAFVDDAVEPGTIVRTDGWGGYNDLPKHGYKHKKGVISTSGDPAHVSMPAVHRVAALLKRWVLGTHQGSVDPAHLQAYLDEFTFRFNRRSSRRRGLLFYRLLEHAVVTPATRYRPSRGGARHPKG
jgi:transposase-like protein/ribosomal protein L37AE/L43A